MYYNLSIEHRGQRQFPVNDLIEQFGRLLIFALLMENTLGNACVKLCLRQNIFVYWPPSIFCVQITFQIYAVDIVIIFRLYSLVCVCVCICQTRHFDWYNPLADFGYVFVYIYYLDQEWCLYLWENSNPHTADTTWTTYWCRYVFSCQNSYCKWYLERSRIQT